MVFGTKNTRQPSLYSRFTTPDFHFVRSGVKDIEPYRLRINEVFSVFFSCSYPKLKLVCNKYLV